MEAGSLNSGKGFWAAYEIWMWPFHVLRVLQGSRFNGLMSGHKGGLAEVNMLNGAPLLHGPRVLL